MSRLEFGPEPKQMEVTDIRTGHFVFTPVEGEAVSHTALDESIRNAGYEIEKAVATVSGTVTDDGRLETPDGQLFTLTAADASVQEELDGLEPNVEVTVRGAWSADEEGETVTVGEIDPAVTDGDGDDGAAEGEGDPE